MKKRKEPALQHQAAAARKTSFKKGIGVRLWQSRQLYVIFALPLLYFLIFRYGAMGWLTLAFKDYNAVEGLWGSEWVGLKHFIDFFNMPEFWKLLRNTLLISLYSLIFSFPVPIILALMINEVGNRFFKKSVQSITYLPHFFSTVIICGMLVDFLTTDGMINRIIVAFGGEPISFLTDPKWFRTIYIASGIWQGAGWGSIMYLAALNSVDTQLYESAVIDGANKVQQAWYISLPAILPIISVQLLLNIGSMLSVGYEKIILLYNGATYETADVISTYVYRRGLQGADYGYGTAVSLFQSVVSLILVIIANRFANKVSEGEGALW